MSSDGEQVFIVEEFGGAGTGSGLGYGVAVGMVPQRRRPGMWQTGSNRLVARELKTEGKLKWEVGGPTGEDEPKLAGAFFLGPPLVLQGRLYALAEMKGQEIRLVVLSAKTRQARLVAATVRGRAEHPSGPERRTGGATPSFADGVLVCPTSAGAIVAVDATTRNLLWGYQYPRSQPAGNLGAMRMQMYPIEQHIGDHWADGTVTIADGKVRGHAGRIRLPLRAESDQR